MDTKKLFPNFMQVKQIIPNWVWHIARVMSVACVVIMCTLLFVDPSVGLFLFWGIFIPFLPLLFFIAPGLWRNICPMAAVNQISREINITRGISTPEWFKSYSYLIAVMLAFLIIPARKYLFDYNGGALAFLLIFFMILAFIGGFLFKGKSGWCTSLCPLLPFQRIYGQTPFVNVRNYHCRPCVGCTESCYDFNPAISYTAILNGPNKYASAYRKLFAATLPGLIVAFFTVPSEQIIPISEIYMESAAIISISVACFYFLVSIIKVWESKIAALFGAASLNLFYWFTFPLINSQYNVVFNLSMPAWINSVASASLFLLTLIWIVKTFRKEKLFFTAVAAEETTKIADIKKIKNHQQALKDKPIITVMPNDRHIIADPNNTLLRTLMDEELPIEAGCCMGMCGADPVTILEGFETLTPADDDERVTLKRLGLSKRCRMACRVYVQKNITVSLTPEITTEVGLDSRTTDKSFLNIKNIVIIGGGVAGMTAASCLHQLHPDCEIIVIGSESYPFYNRMAITRLVYGHSDINNLFLLPKSWTDNPYAECWLNTKVRKIDREKKIVETATHEYFHYDKLILATGSSSFIPNIKNYGIPGCFVMRQASDAMDIRNYTQEQDCKYAIVAGGGLLGLETAYALHKLNLHVTVLERDSRLLPRQLDEAGSGYIQRYLEGLGIKILYHAEVQEVIGHTHLSKIILNDEQEIDCDILLICAGIQPNTELAKNAGLSINRGVVVNDYFCTNDPDIYAIGDVAEIQGKIEGLWVSNMRQAAAASNNILGIQEKYILAIPNTFLKVAGIDLTSIGTIESSTSTDIVILLENEARKQYCKLIISDNKIIGAILIGYRIEMLTISTAIRNKVDVSAKLSQLQQGNLSVL